MPKKRKQQAKRTKQMRYLPVFIILLAVIGASVIVLQPKPNAQNTNVQVAACEGDKAEDFACWTDRYETLVQTQSVQKAFEDLKAVYPSNGYIQAECHQITHVIGRAIAKMKVSVGDAYKQGDSLCWSGYYHGVVEQVAKTVGGDTFVASLNTICADVQAAQPYSFDHYNCVHGLGHGVMTIRDNELFVALKECDNVVDSWNRSSCYGGVFMENVMSDPAANKAHATKYLHADKPLYPCTAVEERYKEQCYLMQTSYALRQINYDFSQIFTMCAGIEENHQNTCYQSVGRDASGSTVSDVARTIGYCELGTSYQQESNCAIGAVKDFISYHHNDTKARELCASFSDEAVRSICNTTATDYYRTF